MKIKSIRYWILSADMLWILGALSLSIFLRYARTKDEVTLTAHFQMYALFMFAAIVVWTLLYFEMNLDGFKGGWQVFAIVSQLIVAVCLLMIVLLAFGFLSKHYYSRAVLLYFGIFFFLGLLGSRCIVHLLITCKPRNMADYRCVILGHGQVAGELARKIATHPELPFQIVGFIFPSELGAFNAFSTVLEAEFAPVKTLGVLELLAQERIQKLIIALPQPMGVEVRKLISKCQAASIRVYLVPDWYDLYLSKAELEEVDGLPMISLQERNLPATGFVLKRIIDFVLSLVLLILVSPILGATAFFVYSRNGRVFRSELRCGKDGISFRMYRLNVERHAIRQFDRLLVRWSLSELPQLWNVLRGDMSLVGPRPESPERVKHYSEWQRQRLKVRGGVTGLAQVNGLRDQHTSEDKARFDLQYIFNWSPLLDLTLILQTVWTVLFRGLSQEPNVSHVTSVPDAPMGYIEREVRDVNRS